MSSRKIEDLTPDMVVMANEMLAMCEEAGIDILVYRTLCTTEEQAKIYRRGRPLSDIYNAAAKLDELYGRPDLKRILLGVGPQYGSRVTNAMPGQSPHNYGLAFDAVPLVSGKPVWDHATTEDEALWKRMASLGLKAGLAWGGAWRNFKDYPHFETPDFNWRDLIATA
jgi:peptidoglycan L-alanyl-D-glutamate endopeptidase CwlK